jgi:hypothetical protein
MCETIDYLNLTESISVIMAAIAVVLGIGAWHREFVGKREIELAEDVLTAFYEAKDAIRRIRNPFSYGGEGKTRVSRPNESAEEKASLDRAYVAFERFEKESELFNKIHSMRYRFMARFKVNDRMPFDDMRKIVDRIFSSAQMLGGVYWNEREYYLQDDVAKKEMRQKAKEHEQVFWEHDENDEVNVAVKQIVSNIESICCPIIQRKYAGAILTNPLWKFKNKKP